jgi:hypothetical protein
MKPFTKAIILACCIAVISSCSKDKISPNQFISYRVDGVAKKVGSTASYAPQDNSTLIDGDDSHDDVSIFINGNIAPGTYHIGTLSDSIGAMYITWGSNIFYNSESGTLVIDSYNGNNISGYFQFTAADDNGIVKNITDGHFSAQIEDTYYSADDGSNTDGGDGYNYGDCSDTTSNSGCPHDSWGVNHNAKLMSRYLHLRQLKKPTLKLPASK